MVLEFDTNTWLPFTEIAALSTEAESVGVKRANVLLLKTKLQKEIKAKNNPKNFNPRLNHPPPWGFVHIFGLAYTYILP